MEVQNKRGNIRFSSSKRCSECLDGEEKAIDRFTL